MFRRFGWHNNPLGDTDPLDGYAQERSRMVDAQMVARGITDPRVIAAMRTVPRHWFVPKEARDQAYEDHPVDIHHGQTISQPFMVAAMTQLLMLKPQDRVLEIGTGSGYQSAVLATLVSHVYTIERVPELAETARRRLAALEYDNVTVLVGDGTLGHPDAAPYDAILVTAGGPSVPDPLKLQLAESGRLVCPVGTREVQHLVRVTRTGGTFHQEEGVGCVFVPLIGEEGWPA